MSYCTGNQSTRSKTEAITAGYIKPSAGAEHQSVATEHLCFHLHLHVRFHLHLHARLQVRLRFHLQDAGSLPPRGAVCGRPQLGGFIRS